MEGKVDNNIRVMPPEMVEALVSRDEDSVVDGYGNKPAGSAKTPGAGAPLPAGPADSLWQLGAQRRST